ncbi:MAG: hypothetical protein EOM12_15490 [Verrucomicrobiae bacterium]|nr:hypothetical protein [Verrucomicrobiae bacterium]
MVPIPTIIMPEEIASNSYSQQWDSAMVKHYIARAFRRLQERQLNYDRQGNRREGPRRKASITRQCSELTGAFKIANGSKALMQLIHYIRFNSPDEIALNHRQQNLLPF